MFRCVRTARCADASTRGHRAAAFVQKRVTARGRIYARGGVDKLAVFVAASTGCVRVRGTGCVRVRGGVDKLWPSTVVTSSSSIRASASSKPEVSGAQCAFEGVREQRAGNWFHSRLLCCRLTARQGDRGARRPSAARQSRSVRCWWGDQS